MRKVLLITLAVALLGTSCSEFNKATTEKRNELCAKYSDWFGTRWIVLPNAMYGDWEASLYDYKFALSIEEKVARKRARLDLAPI